MGETEDDRLRMLEVLCSFDPPPESVPINCLVPMPGTPPSIANLLILSNSSGSLPPPASLCRRQKCACRQVAIASRAKPRHFAISRGELDLLRRQTSPPPTRCGRGPGFLRTLDLQPQSPFASPCATCMKIAIGSDHAGFN